MLGIHISEEKTEGWFGQGKKSAVVSIVVLAVLIVGIAFGIFAAVSARGETNVNNQPNAPAAPVAPTPAAPTPVQTPSVVTNEPAPTGVVEITAEQLIKDLLANPDKYKKGTIFQISGELVWNWKIDDPPNQKTSFFLGPAVYANNYRLGVYSRVYWEEKEAIRAFRALNDKDQVVVRGTYYAFSTREGVSLKNCSIVSVTPAK